MKKLIYVFIALVLTGLALVLFTVNWPNKDVSSKKFHQIDTYSQIQHVFDSCDKRTLITFDVDDSLITASDVMANLPGFSLWFKICVFFKYPSMFLTKTAREKTIFDFYGILFQQAQRFVFDQNIVRLIKQIQNKKSMVIGLTSMESGKVGIIKSMPEWRANMLKNFDIDFSRSFADISFTQFSAYRNTYPCLYKGILCTNQSPKGAVLEAFLDYYHLKPERIISFDDNVSALESIAEVCAKQNISFSGYQILGAKKLSGEWNTRRALLQFDSVIQHARWLSDKEADAILIGEIKHAQ